MPISKSELLGMSTNERLYVAGLLEAFDEAVSSKNSDRVSDILTQVFVDNESITLTLRGLGLPPTGGLR